jgi:hypothetical protein
MTVLQRTASWLTRIVLLFATLLFAMIGRKYVFDPVSAVHDAGIQLTTPMALTTMRASFGAFPLACAVVILTCLVSSARNRVGLWFIAILNGVVLSVRFYGIATDGTLAENQLVLTAETVLFTVTVIALLLGRQAAKASNVLVERADARS